MVMWYVFNFTSVVYYIYWLVSVEWTFQDRAIMVIIHDHHVFLNSFCILLEFLHTCLSGRLVCSVLFSFVNLVFCRMSLVVFLPFLFCGVVWCKCWHWIFLESLVEFSCSLGLSLWGNLITASISLFVIVLLRLFVSSGFNFSR